MGRYCKLEPQERRCDDPHCPVVFGAFLIAGRQAPKLLEAVDQPLNAIPEMAQLIGVREWLDKLDKKAG